MVEDNLISFLINLLPTFSLGAVTSKFNYFILRFCVVFGLLSNLVCYSDNVKSRIVLEKPIFLYLLFIFNEEPLSLSYISLHSVFNF